MSPSTYIEYIIQKMALLNESVRLSNKQSLYNINIISENFYRVLLNIIFDDELVNSNFFQQNNAVFDLLSNKSSKVYQVTSRNDKRKIDETIDDFNNPGKKLYDNYELFFIIIGSKVRGQNIDKKINGLDFNTDNIIDSDDLLSIIKNEEPDKQEKIYDFFRKYFENKLLDIDENYFKHRLEENVENLGERYNKKINILTHLNESLSNFFVGYVSRIKLLKSSKLIVEKLNLTIEIDKNIDEEYKKLKIDIKNNDITNIINYLNNKINVINSNLNRLEKENDERYDNISKLKTEEKVDYKAIEKSEKECDMNNNITNKLKKGRRAIFDFIELFEMANKSLFVLTGKAGMGKTHTVSFFLKSEYIDKNIYSLLILGQHLNERKHIEIQIMENLQLDMTFEELLFALNEYGYKNGIIIPIIIDGINEGLEPSNWKNYINGIVQKISRYKYVKMLISVRDEYIDLCLPNDIFDNNNVFTEKHKGFKENFVSIMNQIFDCYELALPVFPIIDVNFSNPLFVFTFCKTAGKLERRLVIEEYQDFTKVYFDYIEVVSKRLADKFNYDKSDGIVTEIINNIVKYMLSNKNNYIYKRDLINIIEECTRGYRITPNEYLIAIKSEGLIHKDCIYTKGENGEYCYVDVMRFSFERYEKIMSANYLVNKYNNIDDLINDINNKTNIGEFFSLDSYIDFGLLQEMFILIQNKFKKEIYEIINFYDFDDYYRSNLFKVYLDSLIWRKEIYDDADEYKNFRKFVNNFINGDEILFGKLIKLLIKVSFIKSHPLNAGFLHKWLMNFTLADRDSIWTITISNLYQYDHDDEIFHMLQEQCMSQGNKNLNDDSLLLLTKLLGWFCTSSDRGLRDKSTKCIVSILENKIYLMDKILEPFLNVNDMYVLERILGSCYGAILRSSNLQKLDSFCNYIYENFFDEKPLNPNILIRHYCISIIEFASINNFKFSFDLNSIYNNIKNKWYDSIPTNEDIDKYKYDYKNSNFKKHFYAQNTIISSMTTEYGRGTGGYGDFGRYVFQWLTRCWEHHFPNFQDLANIVIKRIFEMGYSVELHGYYDSNIQRYDRHNHNLERIGKKYQWIATYELIGKLCDNFNMVKDTYSDTIIDIKKFTYLDKNYKETRDENKIRYVVSDEYEMGSSSLKNIDPSLFIEKQIKEPIYIDSDDDNWINEEIDISSIIQKNVNGVEYLSLANLEDWVNEEYLSDFNHSFRKKIAIKSMLFIVKDAKKYFKKNAECLCNLDWSTYYHTYIKEFDNSKYYNIEIAPRECDKENNLLFTFDGYCCESGGYDQSIQDSINIYVPSSFIIDSLHLKQKNDYCWYDKEDNLICFDNILFTGNSNLLVNKKSLLDLLKNNNLSCVWGIFYDKTTKNRLNEWRKNVILNHRGQIQEITIEKDGWDISKV